MLEDFMKDNVLHTVTCTDYKQKKKSPVKQPPSVSSLWLPIFKPLVENEQP